MNIINILKTTVVVILGIIFWKIIAIVWIVCKILEHPKCEENKGTV